MIKMVNTFQKLALATAILSGVGCASYVKNSGEPQSTYQTNTALQMRNTNLQMGANFENDSKSLCVDVTAIKQKNKNGHGPAYLLNGKTVSNGKEHWYQIGIFRNWPGAGSYDRGTFVPTATMWEGKLMGKYTREGEIAVSSVLWYGYVGMSSGYGEHPNRIAYNDFVQLRLSIIKDRIVESALDLYNGIYSKISFPAYGATKFYGAKGHFKDKYGFYTNIITEWWNPPHNGARIKAVTYMPCYANKFGAAFLFIRERNFPDRTSNNYVATPNHMIFKSFSRGAANPTAKKPEIIYANSFAEEYQSGYAFITGNIRLRP